MFQVKEESKIRCFDRTLHCHFTKRQLAWRTGHARSDVFIERMMAFKKFHRPLCQLRNEIYDVLSGHGTGLRTCKLQI